MTSDHKDRVFFFFRGATDKTRIDHNALRCLFLVVAVLSVVAAVTRAQGLNPPSLFLDDLWQGILAGASPADQFRYRSSSPFGFTALLSLVQRLVPDPELGPQLLPFMAGLVLIPVMAALVYQLTANPPAALLAAAMVTASPLMAALSIRVKHYTIDALLVAILLWLTILAYGRKGRLPVLIATALISLIFSFSSGVVSMLLIGFLVANRLHRPFTTPENYRVLINWIVFMLGAGLFYIYILQGQKNPALDVFWSDFFPDAFPDFFNGLVRLFQSVLPRPQHLPPALSAAWHPWQPLVCIFLAAIGALVLLRQAGCRWLGVSLIMLYPTLGVMSLFRLYPLGGGRTDLFTYPVSILLISCGFGQLFEKLRLKKWRVDVMTMACGLMALPFCLPSVLGPEINYPHGGKLPEMVTRTKAALHSDDGLIILPHCSFCFAYYSKWPVSLEPCDYFATGFNPIIRQDNVHVLSGYEGYNDHPEIMDPEINNILKHGYPGLVLFTMDIQASGYIHKSLIRAGYLPINTIEAPAIFKAIVYRQAGLEHQ